MKIVNLKMYDLEKTWIYFILKEMSHMTTWISGLHRSIKSHKVGEPKFDCGQGVGLIL